MRALRSSLLLAPLLASIALAQAVTENISPSGAVPTSCSTDYNGPFGMKIQTMTDVHEPKATGSNDPGQPIPIACKTEKSLEMELHGGILTDAHGRVGYIADNRQFQFDGPPQAGAIYTAGFSVCDDGAIAMGDQEVFYQCNSGDFYNLYDESIGAQCEKMKMIIVRLMDCSAEAAGMIGN